jgi:3',5'-cyclic AMP phosphodiesterase CpdA
VRETHFSVTLPPSLPVGIRQVGLLAIQLLLVAALCAPAAFASVSAYVVSSPASLFSGIHADGQITDFVLENDRVAVLITDIGHGGHYAASGGNIMDAGSSTTRIDALEELYTYFDDSWPRQAIYSSISIVDDGSGGGPAVIRVQGVDSDDASLLVETEYSLADGADHVVIRTTLTKTGGGSYPNFEVGDAFGWGGCGTYVPGFGFSFPTVTREPWLAGASGEVSYGYFAASGDSVWGSHGNGWSDVNVETASISPSSPHTFTRYFIVGADDVASVATTVHEVLGIPTAHLTCSVTDLDGGAPIAGAYVDAHDGQDAPYLQMVTDPAGQASTTLPAGDWRLVAAAPGTGQDEAMITVASGDSTTQDFALGPAIIGDTLTVIQRPLLSIPSLVTAGDTLTIECEADPSTTGWAARLARGAVEVPLVLSASWYDPTTLWWTLQAPVPAGLLHELYDLIITADGGVADRAQHAVHVIDQFKDDYYFVHITDTHLPTRLYHYEAGADTDTSEVVDLRAVIDDISVIHPEFVLITGDIVNEGELEDWLGFRAYTRAQRVLAEFDVPIYVTSGNHDIGGWTGTPPPDGTARRDWWRFFGWKRLDSPPPGAPWYTQDFSFDYGPVHYVGLESYINYDRWRESIYDTESFTNEQMQWLADDLASAAGSVSHVLFYHYDFQDEIDLGALGVEMALMGHTHGDSGVPPSPPYELITNNVCSGERAYRLVRVSSGVLQPTPTLSAGSSGQNLVVDFVPANDGTNASVTASIDNNQAERFEHGLLRFVMPRANGYEVTGGTLQQIDDSGPYSICYVGVDIQATSTRSVTVDADTATTGVADGVRLPAVVMLRRNLPNPFRSTTQIRYALPAAARVNLAIYNLLGQRVATLVDERQPAGWHTAAWNGRDGTGAPLPSGVYFARLVSSENVRTSKIVLTR